MNDTSSNKILFIDTTWDKLFVSLILRNEGGKLDVFSSKLMDCHSKHSVILLEEIDSILRDNSLELKDIDTFALSVGPGSFTGIRIGVCTVLGFTLLSTQKIIAVNSLEIDAYNYINNCDNGASHRHISIIDAKHGNAYYGVYDITSEGISQVELGFSGGDNMVSIIDSYQYKSSPFQNTFGVDVTEDFYRGALALVIKRCENGEYSDRNTVAPLYLKKSQAEEEEDARRAKQNAV